MVDVQKVAATRPETPPRSTPDEIATWLGSLVGDPAAVEVRGDGDVEVTGLMLNTQRILPGDMYAALPGARAHGATYVPQALAAGASAVLTDPTGAAQVPDGVPVVVVDAPRHHLGALAARLYGAPATAMRMVGVTGTQGKTTVTQLAEGGLTRSGTRAAVVGTVGTRIAGVDVPSTLTTPEAPELHALFALMREREVEVCAMEVSSHALVMGRVDAVLFDVATFLNLGRDHLDFHTDVEEYFAAKAALFTPQQARRALVNVDDAHGRRLVAHAKIETSTFSASGADADWRAVDVSCGSRGSTFTVLGPEGLTLQAAVPLPGDFNVANALAAIASLALVGADPAAVAAGIASGSGVPGRLESIDEGQAFAVVVDYAHKPDAVEATLRTLRPLTEGRVIVVLGAGGDRDTGKRALMGEIAGRLADVLVVTDDNPRSEDPAAIRAAVLAGVPEQPRAEVLEIGDRRSAIREALRRATAGDIVLVAGKGSESGQETAGVTMPFDDREVVREELVAR